MSNYSESRYNIENGTKIGLLVVGDLVRFVQGHDLFVETPTSYLQQGRLRECTCECGRRRLISESILASGRIKSCGCLRQSIRSNAASKKVSNLECKAAISSVNSQIKIEQARLRALQIKSHSRDEQAIADCGSRIRSLFAQKGILTRKYKAALV